MTMNKESENGVEKEGITYDVSSLCSLVCLDLLECPGKYMPNSLFEVSLRSLSRERCMHKPVKVGCAQLSSSR